MAVFPVSKAQLFILLGQGLLSSLRLQLGFLSIIPFADGLAFKELANRHRATLYVESSPKLAVRAEATKPDLKELGEEINILTKVDHLALTLIEVPNTKTTNALQELTTSDIHLHKALKLGDSIVQSMSRQAGVYMEQIDASTVNQIQTCFSIFIDLLYLRYLATPDRSKFGTTPVRPATSLEGLHEGKPRARLM